MVGAEPVWARDDDATLCARRFCDLRLTIEGSTLQPRVERLHAELAARGIDFSPPVWLSSDWFSPDGVPGIGAPFYLAHPRLARLERSQRLTVEGATSAECMRLLRHEAGHAIDTAYSLSRRPEWQQSFGRRSEPYRASYRIDPRTRDHVHHLPHWYAQSHPADDFAETFAVWLAPRSTWRRDYAGWGAREKLECVDHMMREIQGTKPRRRSSERPYSLARLTATLGKHYIQKRRQCPIDAECPFDGDLRRLFTAGQSLSRRSTAATFLQNRADSLTRRVSIDEAVPPYSVRQVVHDMVLRARELGLQLPRGSRPPTLDTVGHLIARALRRLERGRQILTR